MAQAKAGSRRRLGLGLVGGSVAALAAGYVCLGYGSITVAPVLILGSFVGMAAGIWIGWE